MLRYLSGMQGLPCAGRVLFGVRRAQSEVPALAAAIQRLRIKVGGSERDNARLGLGSGLQTALSAHEGGGKQFLPRLYKVQLVLGLRPLHVRCQCTYVDLNFEDGGGPHQPLLKDEAIAPEILGRPA